MSFAPPRTSVAATAIGPKASRRQSQAQTGKQQAAVEMVGPQGVAHRPSTSAARSSSSSAARRRELAQFSNPERLAEQYLQQSRSSSRVSDGFPLQPTSRSTTTRADPNFSTDAPPPPSLLRNPYIRASSSEVAVEQFVSAHYDPQLYADVTSGRRSGSDWGERSRSRSMNSDHRREHLTGEIGDSPIYIPPARQKMGSSSSRHVAEEEEEGQYFDSVFPESSSGRGGYSRQEQQQQQQFQYRRRGASEEFVEDGERPAHRRPNRNRSPRSHRDGVRGHSVAMSHEGDDGANLLSSHAVFETTGGDVFHHHGGDDDDDEDGVQEKRSSAVFFSSQTTAVGGDAMTAVDSLFIEVMRRFYEAQDEIWRPTGRPLHALPSIVRKNGAEGEPYLLSSPPAANSGFAAPPLQKKVILVPANEKVSNSLVASSSSSPPPASTSNGSSSPAAEVPATLSMLTFTCGQCGAKRSSGNFCVACGGSLPPVVVCTHCSAQFRGKFCNYCGKSATVK